MFGRKKIIAILLTTILLAVLLAPAASAATDLGYNWMDGVDSAAIRAKSEDVDGTENNSLWIDQPVGYWEPVGAGVPYFYGAVSVDEPPKGVVYTDIPLDLTGLSSPKLTLKGNTHTYRVHGINLTFLVEDDGKFYVADTATVLRDEVGDRTERGDGSTPKNSAAAHICPQQSYSLSSSS